jgi:TonB family protein
MKKLFYAALAVTCCVLSVPVAAEQTPHHAEVSAPTMTEWTSAASDNLARSLKRASSIGWRDVSHGVATVQFNCSEDGTPTRVRVISHSGDPRLNVAVRNAVRRMKSMHPLPAGILADQTYEATVVVASQSSDLEEQMAKLRERASRQNARWAARGAPNPVLAFGAISALR